MKVIFIRHAMTAGNQRRAYIGSTDEPLCKEGMAQARAAAEGIRERAGSDGVLAVSPMLRCRRTAEVLFPGRRQRVIEDFRECDFGLFEGKNADELTGDPAYQSWIATNGEGRFPGGEAPDAFKERICRAFVSLTGAMQENAGPLVIVAHGGTIMAVFERFALPQQPFYTWHTGHVQGYAASWADGQLREVRRFP